MFIHIESTLTFLSFHDCILFFLVSIALSCCTYSYTYKNMSLSIQAFVFNILGLQTEMIIISITFGGTDEMFFKVVVFLIFYFITNLTSVSF